MILTRTIPAALAFVLIVLALACTPWARQPEAGRRIARNTTALATRPTPGPFIIGVWQAPVSDVEKWKARGVPDFFGHVDHGGAMTQASWETQVANKGGFFVTYPATQPAQVQAQAFQ